MQPDIFYLHDSQGNLMAVQISASLWQKLEPYVDKPQDMAEQPHDLAGFAGLMEVWNFRYPYVPSVECPHCHASTEDWQKDAKFLLANANIGGLLVFRCRACGATIRQKFFKDHMACEFTPPGQ